MKDQFTIYEIWSLVGIMHSFYICRIIFYLHTMQKQLHIL